MRDLVWQDLKYALRQLQSSPGFALTAFLSLALGIGANTAVFTLVDQIILRLLPVHNPRELVQLQVDGGRFGSNNGDSQHTFSYPTYLALRDRNPVFSGLTGQRIEAANFIGEDRNEVIGVGLVAGNFFEVLGIHAHVGRLLTPDDDITRNGHPVVVLQYNFWQNRLSGKREIVGSSINLNGALFTVVGIAAPNFEGTDVGLPTKMWVPVMMKPTITPTWDALDNERYSWFYLLGRLKPGVSIDQAQTAMRLLYRQRQEEELDGEFFKKFPESREKFLRQEFKLIPAARGRSYLRVRFEQPLIVLQCLVVLVLLIACSNVANLLLARAAAREKEFAIRGALGASRGQLIRQMFVESIVLALAGQTVGLLLSSWLSQSLIRMLPFDPANVSLSSSPNSRILLFTTGVTFFTVLFFGMIPAIKGSQVSPAMALQGKGSSIAGPGHVRLRKIFVALQVGLSCILLIGAGLFTRSLQNLQNVTLGFSTKNVVIFGVRPATPYDDQRKLRTYRSLIEGLTSVPGVKALGAGREGLLTGSRWDSPLTIPGVEAKDGNHPWSFFNAITPGYLEALGIPIKAGRDLHWSDWSSGRKLCLVNEALANKYFGDANPVQRLIAQGAERNPDMEVIGVFGNARYDDLHGTMPRQVFVALDSRIRSITGINIVARIEGDLRQVIPRLREEVHHIDSNLVISYMRTLDDQVKMSVSNERLLSFLSGGIALLATILAVIGLHGVLSFVVTQRTGEIGIRIALGASRARVIHLIIREIVPVILFGTAAGIITSLLGGRLVENQLFGINAADAPVFSTTVMVILATSLIATCRPAWRASRVNAVDSLRHA